jgi:L,D-transpeptidase YcbB
VDDAGTLQIRKDVYGRDATMLSLLRSGKNRDLENVIAHSQPNYVRPATGVPNGLRFANNTWPGNSWSSGPSFFDRLFAPATPAAPPRRPARRVYDR